ncbi:MAG: aminoglycoside phosphotransferase family protein [Patescibacteria group bacterium]|jgi:aminoglycoside phosphotransferase|nr:aminoglycoside phosphotransferase family protein [Patescibacteria group bacterium]
MYNILNLLDEKFVLSYFKEKILPIYPYFVDIKKIQITPYKKMIWEGSYHVVIEFKTFFINKEGGINKIRIICSAHSHEPRERAYQILKYFWDSSLHAKPIEIPHPLFYSEEFRGVFYRALRGRNVLHLLKEGKVESLKKKIVMAADFFARLHELDVDENLELNPGMERIETVIPGKEAVLREMSLRYDGVYDKDLKKAYDWFIKTEEKYFKNKENIAVIHGDAHLENLIDIGPGRLGVIDFSDFCRSDFTRDIGTFMQQVEHNVMSRTVEKDENLAKELKEIFLNRYLEKRNLELTKELQERINLYYYWTGIRTAVYLFLKFDKEPSKAINLFEKIKKGMNL